jgi:hypothetical protein
MLKREYLNQLIDSYLQSCLNEKAFIIDEKEHHKWLHKDDEYRYIMLDMLKKRAPRFAIYCKERMKHLPQPPISKVQDAQFDKSFVLQLLLINMKRKK